MPWIVIGCQKFRSTFFNDPQEDRNQDGRQNDQESGGGQIRPIPGLVRCPCLLDFGQKPVPHQYGRHQRREES